jgi:hypothetical protein
VAAEVITFLLRLGLQVQAVLAVVVPVKLLEISKEQQVQMV